MQCRIEGCETKGIAKGLCPRHYDSLRNHGDPLASAAKPEPCPRELRPTREIWYGMRNRCMNPSNKDFKYYGGRGIAVCERWNSFENFVADMGVRPPGLTLDREDNDKDYGPSNCRWASRKQQGQNKRSCVFVKLDGDLVNVSQACEKLSVSPSVVRMRVHRGQSPAKAFNTCRVQDV